MSLGCHMAACLAPHHWTGHWSPACAKEAQMQASVRPQAGTLQKPFLSQIVAYMPLANITLPSRPPWTFVTNLEQLLFPLGYLGGIPVWTRISQNKGP